jgi:hypothetical protein
VETWRPYGYYLGTEQTYIYEEKRDMTPFQVATERGHDAIARLLLEHGAENV